MSNEPDWATAEWICSKWGNIAMGSGSLKRDIDHALRAAYASGREAGLSEAAKLVERSKLTFTHGCYEALHDMLPLANAIRALGTESEAPDGQ